MNKQIIFIDAQLSNYQTLLQNTEPTAEIAILSPERSGIEQITQTLAQRRDIAAIHILSHGSPGSLKLGADTLNRDTLESFSPQIKQWGYSLGENADILLYGCDAAKGDTGINFIQNLSALTGADVAASDDKTGNIALGGDWNLEAQTGNIETPIAIPPSTQLTYQGILPGDLVWAKNLGGSSSDYGYSIAVDSSGNTYTTGSFQGTADFDPGAGVANLTSAGGSDIFITKLDSSGNYVWAKNLGSINNDQGKSIAVDSSGNTYTTGFFLGTVDFDPGAGVANLTTAGGSDIFITKLDSLGNYVWAKNLGGSSSEYGYSIAVDSSGNTYTTGSFGGTADFDPGAGVANLTSAGIADIFITKLDSSGNYVWAKNLGSNSNDDGKSIAIDSSGNTYTTGSFQGIVDFDPGAGVANLTTAGGSDIFITKLDSLGNYVWAKNLGGSSGDYGYSIAVDSSGNTYTTGSFGGTADFDPGAGVANLTSAGSDDIFITKLDSSGNYVWAKKLGGTGSDYCYSIAVDSSGNTYTTGYFGGTVDFDPGAGVANLTSAGGSDIFITKLDSLGNYVWAKNLGGSSGDYGYSIAIDSSGNAYTTGFFYGTVDFDPGAGVANLTSAGSDDIFIVKLGDIPTVTSLTSAQNNGTYGIGTVIPITVTFSEIVNVTGTPTLTLNTGATATYASGSGSNILTFNYTVAAGNNTAELDYSATTALTLAGGTIKNASNTADAILTLPAPGAANSLGANKNIIIDGIAPTVTIEQAATQTDPAPTSPINYTVTFSEPVTGFDASDINFTGTTAGGTLTPTITGSGTTYNVAVSGMTTSGNVVASIIANAATDTALNGNTASTSTDNTVTYNTIPTVSNIAKTGNEDSNITFAAADFTTAFTDADNDALNKIKITSLPANGTLTLSGGNVSVNQEILLASLPNLAFTPNPDFNGSSSFTWNASDGSNYTPADATVNLTIAAVNDAPSFSNLGNQTLLTWTNAPQTVAGWANTFNFGAADEATTQAVNNFLVTVTSGAGLFTTAPSIAPDGTLTYTPNGSAGTATVQVQLQDNGGTPGVDTSAPATFTITVPPPTVELSISSATGTEAGTTAITVTATAQSAVTGNQTLDLTLTGTATAADFTGTIPTQITIPNGSNIGTVTFTVANDFIDEDDETATLTISNPSAGIVLGTSTSFSFTITDDDTAGVTVNPSRGLNTTEAGGTATFEASFNTQPTADVTINLASDNPAEGNPNVPSLTFTAANWNTPQTVTITGVDDAVNDGDVAYNIILAAATSTDAKYSTLKPADVTVTNIDNDPANDPAGVAISAASLNLAEGGAAGSYNIVLTSAPTAPVSINFNTGSQVNAIAPIAFDSTNWNIPQTVTVTAIDNTIAEGTHSSAITHTATSADAKYNGIAIASTAVTIADNDTYTPPPPPPPPAPGTAGVILILPTGSSDLLEGYGSDIYQVSLNTQPTADVTLTIATDGQTSTDLQTLTFTSTNWNIPQAVTVTAVDNATVEGNRFATINHLVSSADVQYNGIAIAPIVATIRDNENPGTVTTLPQPTPLAFTDADDKITGSAGNDVIYGRAGNDYLNGGAGDDILYGQAGDNGIAGGEGNDVITGGTGFDYINGNAGNDIIYASAGSDRIRGGAGNDNLFGEDGNDYLAGDLGADTLTGGLGNDVFALGTGSGGQTVETADVIADFTPNQDKLDLVGTLDFNQLNIFQGTGANINDTILQDVATGEFLAVLQGVAASSLTAGSFV